VRIAAAFTDHGRSSGSHEGHEAHDEHEEFWVADVTKFVRRHVHPPRPDMMSNQSGLRDLRGLRVRRDAPEAP